MAPAQSVSTITRRKSWFERGPRPLAGLVGLLASVGAYAMASDEQTLWEEPASAEKKTKAS